MLRKEAGLWLLRFHGTVGFAVCFWLCVMVFLLGNVFVCGGLDVLWWVVVETGVEVKKVDSQGRLILPADWREAEVGESRELYVVKRKGYLKIVAKRRVDLTEDFDRVELGVGVVGRWKDFEKRFCEVGE